MHDERNYEPRPAGWADPQVAPLPSAPLRGIRLFAPLWMVATVLAGTVLAISAVLSPSPTKIFLMLGLVAIGVTPVVLALLFDPPKEWSREFKYYDDSGPPALPSAEEALGDFERWDQ